MIPRLQPKVTLALPATGFFQRLVEAGFEGDIETGPASRTVFSTDNSIYQLEPTGILFPRGVEDLQHLASVLAEPTFRGISIAPRGGGTGTNGQSLTSGVVVDCSRHMRSILEIDPVRRVARVQAGVVKDQLNQALKPYGLFFAPELSTSNRATIGGMISTDACGQGSCLYGKTSNHILGLRIVLVDGSDFWSRPLDAEALDEIVAGKDRVGEIHRTVERITREKRDRITEVFPKLNRYMTGYDLAHVRRDDGCFDLNAVLCGSEGTLALIAEAELNLLPIPAHAALINIRYGDFNTALEDARDLAALKVASVETIDEKVLGLARRDIVWTGIARFFPDEPDAVTDGINIVEVLADDEEELERKLSEVTAALDAGISTRHAGYTIARGHAEVEAIWSMRKRAVGLLGNVEGPVRPVAFVEDTAVPPENLAAYIREFRALLDGAGLSYGMFGHVDAGVLHVRPALDLTRDAHVRLVREISDAAVTLTRKYGGVLWGEHGKGVRSEYVPEFFGDLYPCLQEIKRAFDPDNRLNPGKIATPSSEALTKIDDVPLRGDTDRIIGNQIRSAFDNAAYCNGNGACFDFDETSPMCPSYKATRDRRFSPKGRAALMREWLRLLAENGIDPRDEATRLRRSAPLASLARRAFNSLSPANRDDFSHEVRAAMETCLACKACAGQCPVKVIVPAFRSKFLELYYGRYLRPLKDPLVAAIETTLPLVQRIRPAYNMVVGTRVGRRLMRVVGLTSLPRLPQISLAKEAARLGVPLATAQTIEALSPGERQRSVVFVADSFTAYFDPDVALAAIVLARKSGFSPLLAASHVNGKALHVHGYLGRFADAAQRTAGYLQQLDDAGMTLVGLDPSMTLAFRSEYKGMLKAAVLLPQEWLAANLDRLAASPSVVKGNSFRLMPHCTERTNAPASVAQWQKIFESLGIDLQVAQTGCCGMAGTFGHEARNRPISERLYAMSWKPEVDAAGDTDILMATGYSCRSQVKEIDAKRIPHPFQVIAGIISETSEVPQL
ncbi:MULTISPECIES: FAD-binding and (Fe-S)-binding domain-containing protein [Rhizobium]|uniref:D-2-hydroxyglutarate dehydrogenase YdiJ n=1 Tax=Rhizobium TaxID=379 RepID=UPI001B331993|nr:MULTISPECIES: FAD-binding and (Fe-S)-binding domain-containing protein [Rhizobium]MBX4909821.1 FAD-binding oxidoreductase [Rhizobium bangladeshense]MBX5235487.1 FAD-binding oxidoreductase [Rhizobium sp. NLR4a]MBX5252557.1 FAD-binding oxidoreductase [Rhizobium sp. NLR4b]MBX5258952.1 FAD-binding oxidoreductase [Rhizobium sp. NLR16b]MBX5265045.1 FAD-binding oxidoreductase [Rhizobium sp. NLR16a]